jgi:phosphatidylglycerophosphatase A
MSNDASLPAPSAQAKAGLIGTLATLLATGLGSGYSPIAPGTAGTVVGLVLYWPLRGLPVSGQLVATAILFVVGVWASTHVAERVGREDPGIVVVDEVVGIWVTLALLPFSVTSIVAGFLLFRLFDIVKPWPARQLEDLPKGLGIMADDLMAGIYANLALRVVALVLPLA